MVLYLVDKKMQPIDCPCKTHLPFLVPLPLLDQNYIFFKKEKRSKFRLSYLPA